MSFQEQPFLEESNIIVGTGDTSDYIRNIRK